MNGTHCPELWFHWLSDDKVHNILHDLYSNTIGCNKEKGILLKDYVMKSFKYVMMSLKPLNLHKILGNAWLHNIGTNGITYINFKTEHWLKARSLDYLGKH